MTLSAGTRLGPYEILAPLGAGGMGEVYRARDQRLDRDVAIKVLPERLAADRHALERFEREAKAVAALSHPNILAIHDFGREDGVTFTVTELLEGGTLREHLEGGRVTHRKAVEYALQTVHGLAAAHEKGIVHRDLKPENVFVTRDGRVKILDFGLAKETARDPGSVTGAPTAAQATDPGTVLGTVGYMAPEQVRGLPADARSDIFSFGTVLYEMLTGRRAFRAESAVETLNAILTEEPPELATPSSPGLDRIVRRCLEKDPSHRFQNARDLGFAIEAVSGLSAAEAVAVPAESAPSGKRSVAVLLFKDLARSAENAHLGVGLADATITELATVRSLIVRPTAAILKFEGVVDPQQAGRELGVEAVVDGSFQRAGSRLRVTVQLVRTSDGRSLWGSKIDTTLDDIFEMQDQVSRKIAEALEVELTPSEERRLGRGAQPKGKAYDYYLRGRFHLLSEVTVSDVNAAIENFEKATAEDPGFALAWVGLSDAYIRMAFSLDPEGDWHERAERMCARALEIDPRLPEGRYLRGRLLWSPRNRFDHVGAMREYCAALAARPNLVEGHHHLGMLLMHVSLLDEAVRSFEQALAINPGDVRFAHVYLGLSRYYQGRYPEALEMTDRAALTVPSAWVYYQAAHCQIRLGLLAEADRNVELSSRQFPGNPAVHSIQGVLAAVRGDFHRARRQIELTVQNRKAFGHYHHAQHDVAVIHALLGEPDAALEWLAAAAANGFPCHDFFEIDPLLESIRGEPRFRAVMDELRAECDGYRALYLDLRKSSSRDVSAE